MKRVKTQKDFEDKVKELYGNKFKVNGQYIDSHTKIELICNKCGEKILRTPNSIISRGRTCCPRCDCKKVSTGVIRGLNDIWSTDPDVAKYLADSEDGYKYRIGTDSKLLFRCPVCSKTKTVRPIHIKRNGHVPCNYCSNSYSYPNKFMANILDLLNIKFIPEFRFGNSKYRYDFYFKYNDINYLIEMDGAYGHGCRDTQSITIEEQIKIDREKDKLAKKNNYILIRIDCKYRKVDFRFEYIKLNIKKSILNDLFVLDDKLFTDAEINSLKNDYLKFAELWNKGIRSYDELFDNLHVRHRSSVRKYAKKCIELGFVDETYDSFKQKVRLASNNKLAHTKGKPVMCVQTGEIFYSISEAQRQKKITNLSKSLMHGDGYCGYLPNGEKAQWIYM